MSVHLNEPIVSFMIVGSMKSGTTTLNDYLLRNENIAMCEPKEPQYFSRNFDEINCGDYEALWSDREKVCGEASTCYTRWPFYDKVPQRIAEYNSRMKLIYIMRHPVERAYSHFRHNVLTDGLDYTSFADALEKSDEILMTSSYMKQINQYLEFFPRDQLLLVDFDDLTKMPAAIINEIERFLDIDVSSPKNFTTIKSNQSGSPATRRKLKRWLEKVRWMPGIKELVDVLFTKKTRLLIRNKIENYISKSALLRKSAQRKANKLKKMTDVQREGFLEKLIPDIEEMERFWGKDLSKWKS